VSSVAQQERLQIIPRAWASRLIPGSASRHLRGKPQRLDGSLSGRASEAPEQTQTNHARNLRELILPDPISVAGRWQLGWEVAGDTAATLVIWPAIVGTATFFAGDRSPLANSNLLAVFARSAGFSIVFAALITLLCHSEGLYDEGLHKPNTSADWTLARSVALATLILGLTSALSGWTILPSAWFAAGAMLNLVALTARRRWSIRQRRRKCQSRPLNVLIVGAGPSARAIEGHLNRHPELGRVVRGLVDNSRDFGVLGPVRDLARFARSQFADELIVVASEIAQTDEPDFLARIVEEARAHRLDVRIVPDFAGLGPGSAVIESWGDIPVVAVHRERLPQGELVLKRALDVAVSCIALTLLAPLMAMISLVVLADSGLPILYESERVGRKGRRFRCIKFRTMSQGADAFRDALRATENERRGPCFKIAHDPRITRAGRFLRRYSLDELPQLLNVLRGEMSLVGPRPHPPDDFARYELQHLRRLDVTPGLTGLWQVTARQDPLFETNLSLDLEYIEKWSLWMDLQILWRTVGVVLRGTGT
jgi:exopolysaccharide biosynthesis polyprenyl glycosylphosphotransferase